MQHDPLESTFPKERIGFMLADAGVSVLLTQEKLLDRIPEHDGITVCIDAEWYVIAGASRVMDDTSVTATNLAYVVYTSGSTGRPKGVMIPHRGFVNYLIWASTSYGAIRGRGAPVQASIAADAIFPSLFAPLLTGTCVTLVPESSGLDGLSAVLDPDDPFSLIKITPSQLEVLNHQMPAIEDAMWTHKLVVGAEALRGETLTFWRQHSPNSTIINEYGPTETVVGCSAYDVPVTQPTSVTVPIGLPISNTQFYVLDPELQPVAIGVPGELYIAGDGVARGYLNRPGLTADRFIPDPFSSVPGARMYRSGDRVRYVLDRRANIEFLERVDAQVKIRGYRIEPAEVETTLNQHPRVRESLVQGREDVRGGTRLVAYVVPASDRAPAVRDLDEYLRQTLPDYMVPAAIQFLDAFPLTPHGKLDLHALPPLDLHFPALSTASAPGDGLELQLVQIWEDILKVDGIGVNQNFFDVGGHSLLAAQLISRLRQQFKQDLPLATLFQKGTIADLASMLRGHAALLPASPLVAIQPRGSDPPLFCVHPIGGQVLCYMDLARALGPNQPVYGLQSPGLYGEQPCVTRVEDMAALYIESIRTVQPPASFRIMGWSFGGVIAFEMARQLSAAGDTVSELILVDAYTSPQVGRTESRHEVDATAPFAVWLEDIFESHLSMDPAGLQALDVDDPIADLVSRAGAAGIVPKDLDLPLIRRYLRVYESNLEAKARYSPQTYSGHAFLFRPIDGFWQHETDDSSDWQELIAQGVETFMVRGDHFTMLRRPNVDTLAEILAGYLSHASAPR